MIWTGHITRTGQMRDLYQVFLGKLEGKEPLVRPMRKCENSIKIVIKPF